MMHEPDEQFLRDFTASQRRLFLTILSQVGRPADAEEILQNANLAIWRKAHTFEPGTNFAAWSSTVATYEVLKWREKKGRDRLRFSDEFVAAVAREAEADPGLWEERRRVLETCVEKLSAKDRDLLTRRYTPGADGEEVQGKDVAAMLGRPVNAVYQSLGRIKKTLAECVRRELTQLGAPTTGVAT
ncbi:sigma-70 family RNA polymerase sigma factor [Alienimonas sp. DA493]|uniref:sigma-70 family RNA polymerase sigma factor n=1 Tax=Alienimonas sp. DA493 TaxID=3373605 RepID=UPI0037545917